jgi:trk system potassium uptake protein TrkH
MIILRQLKKRYQLIIGYTGTMTIGIGIMLLIPLIILFFYNREVHQAMSFLIPGILSIGFGFFLRSINKNKKDESLKIQEGGVIVIFTWINAVIFSALPFMISGQLNFTQAVFESVSGWTTTGLSVVDVTKTDNIFLFWRSLMQFFGGAGLAVIMLSAIVGPHGLGLYNAEGRSDKLLPNVRKSTKLIMTIYSGYVLAGIILYVIFGMPWFDAINHSMAALSTGGFSVKPGSIGDYNSLSIELITIVLMFLGTINFTAHFVLLKGEVKKFFRIGEIKFMFFLVAVITPIISFLSLNKIYENIGERLRIGSFEVITALSTTGYSIVDGYDNWDSFSVLILIILMIIGGGVGSTAGGIKQYRVYVMLKSLIWNIKQYLLPKNIVRENAINRPEGEYYLKKNHIIEISNFITLYLFIYALGVLIFLFYGYSLQDSMFEFASSLGTVGLSIGITSPDAPKVILWTQTMGMILGRLEFFVIFYSILKIIKDVKLLRIGTKGEK